MEEGLRVFPGDKLGSGEDFEAGSGAYLCKSSGDVRATLLGRLVPLPPSSGQLKCSLHVVSATQQNTQDVVIEIGDVVTGRVVRLSTHQAFVKVLAVGDTPLRTGQQPSAVVRREDIRLTETDSLVVHECFRPGDIIEAQVISLGDARQYFLSTAEAMFGVRWARSETSGQLMVPLSWKEMQDPDTKIKEPRKVAKPRDSSSSSHLTLDV